MADGQSESTRTLLLQSHHATATKLANLWPGDCIRRLQWISNLIILKLLLLVSISLQGVLCMLKDCVTHHPSLLA